jgi:thiamine transport system substrate-binding protein
MSATTTMSATSGGRRLRIGTVALAALALAAACGSSSASSSSASPGSTTSPVTLKIASYDSFAISKETLQKFTDMTGIKVETVLGGDAGDLVNRAILTKGKPEGDVMWGVDNTLLSRAVKAGIFVPYQATDLDQIDGAYRGLVPGHEVTPVDYGDVCINYDKNWFASKGIAPPMTLADLTKPQYKDLLVVENPATSSPGLAFLLATVAEMGTTGWQTYWSDLRKNGVKVDDGWTEAYSTDFSGSSGKGPRPLVLSYASSPPAEIVYSTDNPKPTEPPTGVMTDGCFRQIEFAGILKGTPHEAQAQQLIDFMLSETWQADLPLNMFVFPVREGVTLPDVFTKFAAVPPQPLTLPPNVIEDNRDAWVNEWTTTVLR